ncbi:hypothetical protein LT493_30380 [Streptomyces tricolor]|nr:hypothetical protein [Streptomyces tricolor]
MALTDFLTAPDLIHLAQRHLGLPSLPGMAGEPAGDLSVAVPEDAIEHHIRGRDALLAELAERITRGGGRTVLCGVGGSGKSTVALALARRGRAEGLRVWWVDATTRGTFEEGVARGRRTGGCVPRGGPRGVGTAGGGPGRAVARAGRRGYGAVAAGRRQRRRPVGGA